MLPTPYECCLTEYRDVEAASKNIRDHKGRFLPGMRPTPSQWLNPLKEALKQSISAEQLKDVMGEMVRLSTGAKDEKVRVEAAKVVLERLFGKVRQVHIVENEKSVQSIVNVRNLSNEELDQMIELANKTIEQLPPGEDD